MRVELRQIHKSFGPVHANDGISLTIPAGMIQGILGENGAGKTTLMKILSGFQRADRGEIWLDGRQAHIRSPQDTGGLGIGMLHQDPLDVPAMRVVDNFLLGRPGGVRPRRGQAREALQELAERFGFTLDPEAYVDGLTVGERQQLELLRLLWLGARVLILDEPTTGISALQKDALFASLRKLSEEGRTIIFVSHKLEDVENLCHRVAVLRRGQLVGEVAPPYDTDLLVEMMFGRVVSLGSPLEAPPGERVLELDRVIVEDRRMRVGPASLHAGRQEVIGLAGMEGSGQQLFLRACAGLVRPVHGRIHLAGEDVLGRSYHGFLQRGVGFMPAARLEEGLIAGLDLTEHFALTQPHPGFMIQRQAAQQRAGTQIEAFHVKGTPQTSVEDLSGGNQQRALLALLREKLSLLLLEHPTRGLDIESVIWIWDKLKERCRQGTAIIFVSSDLDEILHYSDRIHVFFGGRVSTSLSARTTTVEQLGQLIGGKSWPEIAS
ncbi:MAG: transporter related [Anaerolineales bacterium]|nr:transporter related [Anaerolineales bacterium]